MRYRQIEPNDAAAYLAMMQELDKETSRMMLEPGERSTDVSAVKEMIVTKIENRDFFMIAEDEGEIVGMMTADKGEFRRIRHTAYVVTGIRAVYRGQGIGSRFFIELDRWAMENHITRLELTVQTDNIPAIHLYEKNGFVIEGTKQNSMIVNDEYIDEYYMAKLFR